MMRVNDSGQDSHTSLFTPYKAPSSTFFNSAPRYESLPNSNGDTLTRTYINKFENYPSSNSTYTSSSPERPFRSYSPSKYENIPSSSTISPKLSSKFPRYFGSGRWADLDSHSIGNNSGDAPKNSYSLSSFTASTTNDSPKSFSYSNSYSTPLSFCTTAEGSELPARTTYSRFSSLPPLTKADDGSSSPLLSSISSRLEGASSRVMGSPKLSSPTNSFDSTSSSSFLKLARLNLTPVKFRAQKLAALGRLLGYL